MVIASEPNSYADNGFLMLAILTLNVPPAASLAEGFTLIVSRSRVGDDDY